MLLARLLMSLLMAGAIASGVTAAARAQPASGPPAVGVVEATTRPVTETSEFLGRIEAINRVNVVARVTAFLDKRLFNEGAEIKKGDQLYRLERGPFEADLASKQAHGGAVAGDAGKRQADHRSGADPARRSGRPAIDL